MQFDEAPVIPFIKGEIYLTRTGQKAVCLEAYARLRVDSLPPQFSHNHIFLVRDARLDCEYMFDEIISTYKNGRIGIATEHPYDIVGRWKRTSDQL